MQNKGISKQSLLKILKGKMSKGNVIHILFVCSGNIMRSPIAEMLFEKMIQGHSCQSLIKSESGAVVYHNSRLMSETRQILLGEGISSKRLDSFYPRHISDEPELFKCADLILVMEQNHLSALGELNNKSFLLKDFTIGVNEEIGDPYFGASFTEVIQEIKHCLEVLTTQLCSN